MSPLDDEWRDFEAHVNDVLGLSSTPASGARWQAIGDGVDNDRDSAFPLIADAKFTRRRSFVLNRKLWRQWQARAAELGKRFIMPIRLWPKEKVVDFPVDVVVIDLNDFAELLELAKRRS